MKRLFFFALVVYLSVPASAATRFGALVEGFSNLKAGPSAPVSNVTYSIGHLKITLASGSASPVMAADQKVALFFSGQGSFSYTADDPVELPLLKRNAKTESNLKVDSDQKSAVVSGNVSAVMIYAGGTPLPEIAAGTGAPLDLTQHFEQFGRDREEPVSHAMILQALAAPATKYVRVEMKSGGEMVSYMYDAYDQQQETLSVLRPRRMAEGELRKRLYPINLSLLPVGRDRKTPPAAPYMLTDLDYTLVADGDDAKLEVTETIARDPRAQALRFNQVDSELVKLGAPERHFHVLSITDAAGRSLPFHHQNNDLIVGLEGVSGDTIKLRFKIEGDFLYRPNNDNAWQLGIYPWFPQPELNGGLYTLHSTVKVKKPFIGIAPGTTVRRVEEGDYNVVENKIDVPVTFAVVHAGKYEMTEDKRGPLTVRVASYAGRNERAAKQLTDLAFSLIDYYQWFLGPFPLDEFNIIQVNTFGYGQAPPGTMFITNEAFNSVTGEENRFFSQGINERFAHEIAHQYWGVAVKMPSEEEQWLTESFAEYSAALAIKKFQGNGKYDKLVQTWKVNAKEYNAIAPIALANHIAGDAMNAFFARTHLLYSKGPYLLYALHKELGDNQFLTFMKSYQKSFRWKFGSTAHVAGLLKFMTQKDYMPFLDQYYWGTAMPN